MSTWPPTTAYPPIPRRSSSRSPPRGAYAQRPPYPESGYPQDPYRADWDAYDRDRAWANYDRDRAAYEYGRRGRSRSPTADDSRKRRRSISPYERGRYEPRPRYGDDYDAHSRAYGYSSPRRGHYPPSHQSGRRAPPDPHTFDYPSSLKQYAEWFRYFYPQQATEEDNADKAAEQEAGDGSKPRNGIKSRWEKYKKDFAATQLQTMFEHHRKSPWFAEKYDPSSEFVNLRARIKKEGWKGRLNNFLLDIETGKYDPDFNEPEPEPTSPNKETGGDAPTSDANPPSTPADEVKASGGDDEMQFNVDADDEPVDNDAPRAEANGKGNSDNKRGTRGEEVSVQPEGNQVMIRTIPPDIGRVKLEEACGKIPGFVYLALGDPLQKRNFYRAGWLRFSDDADMANVMTELSEKKIEGFKLHVTHNVRPFVNKIRYTPEVASRSERLVKDLANTKVLASILEEEAATLRKAKVTRKSNSSVQGDNGQTGQPDAVMSDANIQDSNEDVDEEPEPSEKGSEAVERRIEKVMADLIEQGQIDASDEKALEAKKTLVALDLYHAYLRAAFHTCYYCAVVTDHLEELQRKCLKHVRKPLSKQLLDEIKTEKDDEDKEKEPVAKEKPAENRDWKRNDERWLDWLDSKIALLINRNGVDPRDYGGKSYDEELTKTVEPFIKQEDEGKFRCKNCQKLFKATSFVEKHIANKHPELVNQLEELPYFNNFALDPHRIQPFAHPPQTVGNSQAPPPQAYGIQGPVTYPGVGEYGRPAPFYPGPPHPLQGYPPPPPYANGGYWDHYGYQYAPGTYPPPPVPRRDDNINARRLSERISGYAPGVDGPGEAIVIPANAGLPAKPPASVLDPSASARKGGRAGSGNGLPPPPPPDAKEDPRAAAGKRVSYHDMDLVAEGDVELTY